MPRRSKKEIRMSYEEQIQEIENKIEEHKEGIGQKPGGSPLNPAKSGVKQDIWCKMGPLLQ